MTNWLRRNVVLGALCAGVSLQACAPPPSAWTSRASGSLALSTDDALLYAVDSDNGQVSVIDTAREEKIADVKVGQQPVRVLVGADDTVYVANRGSRSVSVIRRGDWKEATRLEVGVEPTGLALAESGRVLLVTSSTSLTSVSTGTLAAFDTSNLQPKWEIAVGPEPRAVAVIAGNRALVTLSREGELVEVDLAKGTVTKSSVGLYAAANASKVPGGGFSSFRARAMNDLVVTPDGTRVFAPTVWAREDAIARRPTSAGGYYSGGGPCNIGAVATAGIVTLDTTNSPQPKVDDLTSCSTRGTASANENFPTTTLGSRDPASLAIQGPTVGVVDPTGDWLFVVNRESQNVAIMPTWRRTGDDLKFEKTGTSVRATVKIGAGADGIAISADGKKAYVYSQFDHRVDVLQQGTNVASVARVITVAQDTLSPELAQGRRLFFDANDPRMSSKTTTVACSTCHLEGREDGHVWEFPDGPRQTPALAGRKLLSTAPYHWSGEFTSLDTFNTHTITERMGGSGLTRADEVKLDAFIDQLPLADNALRTGMNSDSLARGRAAFDKAGCDSCHAGALFTNNQNASVGTLVGGKQPDKGLVVSKGFNVPSLLGLGRSAPYLHDGSQATLEDRILNNANDAHGQTAALSAGEKSDLIAFLKSL